MKIFGREPTLVLQMLQGVLTLLVTFGLPFLTSAQAGTIVAGSAAAITAVNAWAVKPVAPAVFSGVITASAALLTSYGLHFTQEQVGAAQLAVTGIVAFLVRAAVTPEADPQPGGGVPKAVAGEGSSTPRV